MSKVFGVSLENQKLNSENVPVIIVKLISRLKELDAQNIEGIFRIPGNHMQIELLKKEIDEDENYDFSIYNDVYVIASLLKQFFRELPESILTDSLFEEWNKAG
ncbi:rho gtpase-activating protein 68f [Anaeramoeba ignava]|uniref:Rho gtpase-activating protein 68f n=1 Tax=Anaeramoeba ignava TaxID=1746090 RepID=A0A9Q0R7K1_ANAIG|nr:rho gtpase-activating protein 68f [Anaeramoeba ignava]